jgi:hypothetical protein
MGCRIITDLETPEFAALFTGFKHTAYRLETLQHYGVGYEDESFRAFAAGKPLAADSARDGWTANIRSAVAEGKTFQRVHLVNEPLSEYLRYEMKWWYGPNAEAGDDVRILPAHRGPTDDLAALGALSDYWLFDSSDLWIMNYDTDGKFRHAEQVSDLGTIVTHAYWRDAAMHYAIPYADYLRREQLLAAS